MDSAADSFSTVGYTDELGRFGPNGSVGGNIVTADCHPGSGDGIVNGAEFDEEGFLFAGLDPGDIYHNSDVTIIYHFKDKEGNERKETLKYNISGYFDLHAMLSYADVACGQPGTKYIKAPPALPEGYRARADTQKLIDDDTWLLHTETYWDGEYWEGTWYGDLYYEAYEEDEDEKEKNDDGNEGENEGEAAASGWISIVDLFASTGYGSEGYVITDVEFSSQNLLTHMKLTAPSGDFVVYADEAYHYNLNPAMGSST
jgi:hypothetical protein